jgi:ABC-type uncharacterized transport system auxiliary subunit
MSIDLWQSLRSSVHYLSLGVCLLLVACVSAPSIPETTWHRLPAPGKVAPMTHPTALPLAVHRFEADGLYADQALLYALDADAQQLRAYHYHQWIDPPGTLLQRRWMQALQQAQAAAQVVERTQAGSDAWQLRGRIVRWERVPMASGAWQVQIDWNSACSVGGRCRCYVSSTASRCLLPTPVSKPACKRLVRHWIRSKAPF